MNLRINKTEKINKTKYHYAVFYTFIGATNAFGYGFAEIKWNQSIKYITDLTLIIDELLEKNKDKMNKITITGYNLLRIEGEEDGTESGEKKERTENDQQVPQTTQG